MSTNDTDNTRRGRKGNLLITKQQCQPSTQELEKIIQKMLENALNKNDVSAKWNQGIIISIHKKGERS